MAERFVRGYAVSIERLFEYVGSDRSTGTLLGVLDQDIIEEVAETLETDTLGLEALLQEILSRRLNADSAYGYLRVAELVLTHLAPPLEPDINIIDTHYLPNDSRGRWNPVLEALGLPKLAARWGSSDFTFPWRRRPKGWRRSAEGDDDAWPSVTLVAPSQLTALRAELDTDWEKRLTSLPGEHLAKKKDPYGDDRREELRQGLGTLRDWLDEGLEGRDLSLVLWMDGDC